MPQNRPQKRARRITPEYLHNAALFYLQRYAASTERVRRILRQKIERSCRDHPDQVLADLLPLIEVEIATLTRVQLLQDDRLARASTEGYRARGLSARVIQIKLQQRGFTPDVIAQAMIDTTDPETNSAQELDAARRYLKRRRLGPYAVLDPADRVGVQKNKQKAWAALARQGYDPDIITAAMSLE